MANGSVRNVGDQVDKMDPFQKRVQKSKEELEKELRILANVKKKYRDDDLKQSQAYDKKIAQLKRIENQKSLKQRLDDAKKAAQEEYNLAVGFAQKSKALSKEIGMSFATSLAKGISSAASSAMSGLSKGIDQYINSYSSYMSGIETRLQGASSNFSSITNTISSAIGSSQYVKQSAVLQNLSRLVEQGIAYNVEQRAFLMTVSDRIANTFDSFDSSLMRIIRIQQADSTIARLGMESTLTKFLNGMFEDTSYLNSLSDTVSASLLSASSTMGRNTSVEFEYAVQKWLGSMSSIGVSDSTIQSIAQGLGYLGSGNVSSLSNNSALQNLLVMASSYAGLDYGSLLTGGVSPTSANSLLRGIVQLSQDIANTNNRVVLSQYAQIFGMDISDLMALSNLTSQNLVTISENMLEYGQLYNETISQISTIGSRMTLKDRIDTMFDNVMSSVGENIANNAATYTTWLVNNMIMDATGGGISFSIPVPFVGFKDINVNKIIQTGIVGLSTLSEIGSILSGLSGRNNLSLDNWGAESIRTSGKGFTGLTISGTSSTTSQTTFIGNADSSDIYQGSIASAQESTEAIAGGDDSNTRLMEIIENDIATDIKSILRVLTTEGVLVRDSILGGQF